MFHVTVTGKIASLTEKELKRPDGEPGKMLVMRIAVRNRVKDTAGQWVDDTVWCEAVAYDKLAEGWARFSKGDAVECTGRGEVSSFVKEDGTVSTTIRLRGIEGYSPSVSWSPRHADEAKGDAPPKKALAAVGAADDDFV